MPAGATATSAATPELLCNALGRFLERTGRWLQASFIGRKGAANDLGDGAGIGHTCVTDHNFVHVWRLDLNENALEELMS
jgi:hypothetical protein